MSRGWLSSLGCSITRLVDSLSLARRLDLMSGLGPTAKVLSFAPPKESTQRKGGPDAAFLLRSGAFAGGCRKGLPAPSSTCGIPAAPLRADPAESSGARRGIRENPRPNSAAYSLRSFVGRISDSVMRRMIQRQHTAQYGCAY